MKAKVRLREKVNRFFDDDRKRSIFILCIVVILLIGALIAAYYYTVYNATEEPKSEPTTVSKITTDNLFRGYQVKDLNDNSYSLDLASKHEIVYSSNKKTPISTCVDDLELIYEVSLKDGNLEFDELRKDEILGGQVYTNNKYFLKLDKKITNFVIGYNCTSFEYTILVLDESNNIYRYENTNTSNMSMKDIVNSFQKVKTISTPKKIGYYNYNNEAFLECAQSKMVYLDKANNIRLLDKKNTLFYDTVYYTYLGNEDNGDVVYVFKDKLMKYSNIDEYLNNGVSEIQYRGSFHDDKNLFIISSDNYLYKISLTEEFSNPVLTSIGNSKIKRIGSRIVGENNYVTNKNSIIIEFENGENVKFDVTYEYEILGV